jgi:hypothetical protein
MTTDEYAALLDSLVAAADPTDTEPTPEERSTYPRMDLNNRC